MPIASMKELKERVETAGFVTEEFDALSGQYEVSILKLGAPQQRLMEFAFAQGVPGRLAPAKLQRRRGGAGPAPRVQRDARRLCLLPI